MHYQVKIIRTQKTLKRVLLQKRKNTFRKIRKLEKDLELLEKFILIFDPKKIKYFQQKELNY